MPLGPVPYPGVLCPWSPPRSRLSHGTCLSPAFPPHMASAPTCRNVWLPLQGAPSPPRPSPLPESSWCHGPQLLFMELASPRSSSLPQRPGVPAAGNPIFPKIVSSSTLLGIPRPALKESSEFWIIPVGSPLFLCVTSRITYTTDVLYSPREPSRQEKDSELLHVRNS